MSGPGTLIATLVVFTGTGPLTCRLHHGTDNRIVASIGTRRWRMRHESLARFLAALADDGLPPPPRNFSPAHSDLLDKSISLD